MGEDDLAHDAQPEAAALAVAVAEHAVEALEHRLTLLGRDSRAVVADRQPQLPRVLAQGQRHVPARRGIAQGVVDQVGDRGAQHRGVAAQPRRPTAVVKRQVDPLVDRKQRKIARHLAHQLGEVERLPVLQQMLGLFGAGQGQHLVGQVTGAADAGLHAGKGTPHFLRVELANAVVGLRPEHCERGADLVCRVGEEAAARLQHMHEAGEVVVDGVDQRPRFARHVADRYRCQVVGTAPAHRLAQIEQGPQGTRKQHHQHHHRRNDEQDLPAQAVEKEAQGHLGACFGGFGKEDGDRVSGGQRRVIESFFHHREAHRVVAETGVEHARFALAGGYPGRQAHVLVAGQRRPVGGEDGVEDAFLHVLVDEVERRIRDVGADPPVGGVDALGDALDRGGQRTVVGVVGRLDRAVVRPDRAEQQNCQQRGHQPAGDAQAQADARIVRRRRHFRPARPACSRGRARC